MNGVSVYMKPTELLEHRKIPPKLNVLRGMVQVPINEFKTKEGVYRECAFKNGTIYTDELVIVFPQNK